MNSVISFIIVLGLLIFVHEAGHFILAKFCGVKVLKFSLGFGPKIFGRQVGETEYLLSAFPLGGYVKMFGEKPNEDIPTAELDRSFSRKPVWQRFLIVGAGPFSNLGFAVLLFFLIFAVSGIPEPDPEASTRIGMVSVDSPAAEAGLKSGDTILSINGLKTKQWADVSVLIRESKGQPVRLEIRRDDQVLRLEARPKMDEVKDIFGEKVEDRYILGISRSTEVIYVKASLGQALLAGLEQTWTYIYLTVMGIVKIFQRVIPASELGGPILIAQMAGKQMEAGWLNLLYFMGLISVNLGILNLLPVPILDGGHLFFFSIEALRGRPISEQTQEKLLQFGMFLLVSLMVFVFYNDLSRIFFSG